MMSMKHILFAFLLMGHSTIVASLEITHVYHDKKQITSIDNKVTVFFTLSDNADAMLNIYDDRDYLIRSIQKASLLSGTNSIEWDGNDFQGNSAPAEAYHYTLTANSHKDNVTYDVTDLTGNKLYTIKNIKWSKSEGAFIYNLANISRVLIRVGLKEHGPLLVTISNWEAKTYGQQVEKWNGKDATGVLELSNHPNLFIFAQAYTLSDNTILVATSSSKYKYIPEKYLKGKRESNYKHIQRIAAPQQQKPETRGDFVANLSIPGMEIDDKLGAYIVNGTVPITLDLSADKRELMLSRRMESVYYVDGQFTYESEISYLPMTWKLDTSVLNEGEHFVSVNLRGYEGNFGLATLKLYVQPDNAESKK